MKKALFFSLIILKASFLIHAQENKNYGQLLNDDEAKFADIQNAFYAYWKGKTPAKGEGYKAFRRYEERIKDRLDPKTGRFENHTSAYYEYQKFFANNANASSKLLSNPSWQPIGPQTAYPLGGGAGRLNCITVHPTNPSIIFVGAASGGIWRSYNGGSSWVSNTDALATLAISDIAFNPKNPNIIYAATGDRDAGDDYSIGVLKSTDGGITWNPTGLIHDIPQTKRCNRLLVHPINPDTILVATTDGIFKTYNGGTSWALKFSGNIRDMEFKPGNPNVVYASNLDIYLSINNGENFTNTNTVSSTVRIAIAVTPANPNYVYAIASNANYGLQGIYRSVNSGVSFSLRSSSPNVLNWSEWGTGSTSGQAWYDLAIAASPTNAEVIFTGGVNVWKSVNGGQTMVCNTHWAGSGGLEYVHADIHDIMFANTGELFVGCDGGIFVSYDEGTFWIDYSNGLNIAQIYEMSTAQTDTARTISGWQDNGSSLFDNGSSTHVLGADGMDCQINPSNSNIMYASYQEGVIFRSNAGGGNFNTIASNNGSGVNGIGEWVTPVVLDPATPSNVYIGKGQLYKSTNGGVSGWTQVGTLSMGLLQQIAISSDITGQYIYVSSVSNLQVKKGAAAFTSVNSAWGGSAITYIGISPNDKKKVWVTVSNYNGNTCFYSNNAGTTWTNISAGLPLVPATCVIHQENSPYIYVGTDIGLFYKDTNSAAFAPMGQGLPNVSVTDIAIQKNIGKLRIATYGRGLWEIDAIPSVVTAAPVAAFTVSTQSVCAGQPVTFQNNSTNFPSNVKWTLPGTAQGTSNAFNPTVSYLTTGTYLVKLYVSNNVGADSITQNAYINVLASPSLALSTGTSISKCKFNDTVNINVTGAISYSWQPNIGMNSNALGAFQCYTQLPSSFIIRGFGPNGCYTDSTITVTIKQSPLNIGVVKINNGFKATFAGSASLYTFQWYLNGAPIPNSNNDTLISNVLGAYACKITIANGCGKTSTPLVYSSIEKAVFEKTTFLLQPNPSKGAFVVKIQSNEEIAAIQITDILGREILRSSVENNYSEQTLRINNAGVYFVSLLDAKAKTVATKKLIID